MHTVASSHVSRLQIFSWVSVLSVASSESNKQIELYYYDESKSGEQESETKVDDGAIRCKCEDYDSRRIDMKIYISSKGENNLSR